MSPSEAYSSPAEFAAVDAAGDPAALIEFMDAAGATSGLAAARRALLDRLALGNAAAALDVGDSARTWPRWSGTCHPVRGRRA